MEDTSAHAAASAEDEVGEGGAAELDGAEARAAGGGGDPESSSIEDTRADQTRLDEASEMERLEEEKRQLRDLAQRKQAEFENYRKRVERERADMVKYAAAELVREILPVLDNLERAVGAADAGTDEQLRQGVEIISKQFKDILVRQGLDEVEAADHPFDPHVHEAVSRVTSADHAEGTVVEVFQKGYRFKDRLLRPSMVSVAQPGTADDDTDEMDRPSGAESNGSNGSGGKADHVVHRKD